MSAMFYRMDWKVNQRKLGVNLAVIDEYPDLGVAWFAGARIAEPVPTPIRCVLDPERGTDLPDVFLTGIPLFSARLVALLGRAGVDNIDFYDAEIVDPKRGKSYRTYKAGNIIGVVKCADLEKSEYDARSQFPMIEFKRIVLEEDKIGDLRLFRLAENPLFILIADSVKKVLEAEALVGVRIISLEDPRAY